MIEVDKINNRALNLISGFYRRKEKTNKTPTISGSAKERGIVDWSDKFVSGDVIRKVQNDKGYTIDIQYQDNNEVIGLVEDFYIKFTELLKELFLHEPFKSKASFEFIETKSFEWLIRQYRTNDNKELFYNYLISELNYNIKEYEYFFPVVNLEIEGDFIIGRTRFTYFTKSFFDNLYEEYKSKMTTEQFDAIYRKDFQGVVLARICVEAEENKAKEIAVYEAGLSIDILKIYGITPVIPERKTLFDLNFRLGYQPQIRFLSKNDKKKTLYLSMEFQNDPFNITYKHIYHSKMNGLDTFSNFISHKKNNELYRLISQGINLLGNALSIDDLHIRSINLITLIESLLLMDEEETKLERKTKARLSKILSTVFEEKEKIKTSLSLIYKVRHKMVHKAIRLSIDVDEMINVQLAVINLLLKLINYNSQFSDKNSLIEFIDKIKS